MEDKPRNVSDRPRKRQYGRVLLDAFAEIILRLTTFSFGFAWWGLKWSVAVVIFLAIMAVAGYYVFNEAVAVDAANRIGVPIGKDLVVPDVQGSHKDTARRTLEEAGLSYSESIPMPSAKIQRDYVMLQRPEPGSVVRAGRRVFVTLSHGQDSIAVPDVRGMAEADARTEIERAALTVGSSLARYPGATVAAGTVINQDPLPGQVVAPSTAVSLLLSEGQASLPRVLVPNLVGLKIDEAKTRLTQLGLAMVKAKDPDTEAEIGVVLKQFPEYGKEISEGGTVTVNVRLEEDVPDLAQRQELRYTVPPGFGERDVRITTKDAFGESQVAFQQKVKAGYSVIVTLVYTNIMTAEVYLDGALRRRIVYEEGKEPHVTEF